MFLTIKVLLLLIVQISVVLTVGRLVLSFGMSGGRPPVGLSIVTGFVCYHAVFWILAYPWALLGYPFLYLCGIWLFLLIVLVFTAFFKLRRSVFSSWARRFAALRQYPVQLCLLLLFSAFIVFISTRNGFLDIDSQTYIGEVTTIIDTNRILSFIPSTGLPMGSSYFLHRGCSMFGAESAFWCTVFKIHPLIYCRVIRAALNPIFLLSGTYSLVRLIGFPTEKALSFLLITCPAFILFDNSGYSSTRFLLHRGYEGKAYLSGTLIVFTAILCCLYMKQQNRFSFCLLLLNELATLSVSASALYLIPPLLAAILGAYIITQKKWRTIPLLIVLLVPNMIFALLKVIG